VFVIDFIRKQLRAVAHSFARLLNRLGGGKIRPNHVTLFGLLMHLPVAILIAYDAFVGAAVLLFVFGMFDAVDGELARLQQQVSSAGMVLDASTDRIKEALVYSGVAYWITLGPHPTWAFLAVAASGAALTTSYIKAKGEVAYAVSRRSRDHQTVNRHFKESLAPFEIRMGIIIIGLLTSFLMVAICVNLVLSLLSIPVLLRSVLRQLKDVA
jgi:phosphatidylglycerophosphate synthase